MKSAIRRLCYRDNLTVTQVMSLSGSGSRCDNLARPGSAFCDPCHEIYTDPKPTMLKKPVRALTSWIPSQSRVETTSRNTTVSM